MNMTD